MMRPRHSLTLLLLAALPVVLALILVGNGNLVAPRGTAQVSQSGGVGPQVALQLLGGPSRVRADACGKPRSYAIYPSRGSIHFIGAVIPRGTSQLSLKLKACYGGQFQSAGSVHAAVRQTGVYSGSFPIPIAGYYEIRAETGQGSQQLARSQKLYFEVP